MGSKLGGDWWELEEMFDEADWNEDGVLDIYEQDEVWLSLMEDDTEKAM